METKPTSGLGASTGKPVMPPGVRLSPFIDYIKLVLRFRKGLQRSSIEKHMPEVWRCSKFIKLTFAPHIPSANRTARNASDCYTLTIHEPHKHRFSVDQLWTFLTAADATLDRGMSIVEWGIDIYLMKEASLTLAQLGQLAEDITRCLNIQGIDLKLSPFRATSRTEKNGNAYKRATVRMEEDVADNWTVYIGEQPEWKISASQYRWLDCIGFKCYYKVTDDGYALPESEHRLRLEFTASGTHCPVDAIDLLQNDRLAKKKLATYFWMDLKSSGLLFTIQHGKRACVASMSPAEIETARRLHMPPIQIYFSTPNESCRMKYHKDDVIRPRGNRRPPADNSGNDRMSKAFERLNIGDYPQRYA